MRNIAFTLFIILLISCKVSTERHHYEKAINIALADGRTFEADLFYAPNGEAYYVFVVDSVNYQEALSLQQDGFVLPRMYGVYSIDEHRHYITMPTWEVLLGLPMVAADDDVEKPNAIMKVGETALKQWLEKKGYQGAFWSGTRVPTKGTSNHALIYGKTDEGIQAAQYVINDFEGKISALLIKRAVLVEKKIADWEYYINDTLRLSSDVTYTAADGYDYYVLNMRDSLYTWYEAINMERDGWMLLRTEGRYYGMSALESYWRKVEYWRLHSEGFDATIEGISGKHPFVNIESVSGYFKNTFQQPVWTGTIRNNAEAFLLQSMFGSSWCGNMWEHYKYDKAGYVCLVKRIISPSAQYHPKGSEFTINPMKVQGVSGKEYYIVDPLGWRGFGCKRQEVTSLEQPDWHIITYDELNDMLGLNGILNDGQSGSDDHPWFYSLFPFVGHYYIRANDGEMKELYTWQGNNRENWMVRKSNFIFSEDFQVRLVYKND